MIELSRNLLKLLNGYRCENPPFWEVWFCMHEFCNRRYGDYNSIDSRIRMAQDLGMAAVFLGAVDTNVSFAELQPASDGSIHYTSGSLKNLSQLSEKPLPDWKSIRNKMLADREAIRKSGLACWIVLPWCFHSVATSMGLENFSLAVYDDPSFIDTAFEWVEERNRMAIDSIISEIHPDFVLFDGDCAHKTGLMIQPSTFRKLTFEKTAKTVSRLKALGIPYCFHTDGKLDEVIPMLIELGFAAVHGCEKAANDLSQLVANFGDHIVLVGNMDVVLLATATPEMIIQETLEMLRIGSHKGRFIAACNTSPQDYIPEENYNAFAKTIREFKRPI